MRKIALLLVVVLVACAFAVTVGIISYETTKKTSTLALLKSNDISLPDGLNGGEFGLFFYDENGEMYRTDEDAPFDRQKPLVVLSYALMQGIEDDGEDYVSPWQSSGYNVGALIWNQMSEDDGAAAEEKIWTAGGAFIQRNNKGGYAKERLPYSVAECMTAYYLDFMEQSQFEGGEIRFVGHSVGGQLITAVASYLVTLEQNGLIDRDFLPDRVTLLDCVFSNNLSNKYINWLEKPLNGSIFLAAETIKSLKEKGAAVEYVRSSFIDMYTETGGGAKGGFANLTNQTTFLELRSDWLYYDRNQTMLTSLGEKHLFSRMWYTNALIEPIPLDYSSEKTVQYGVSPNTPTSYTYARAGTKYLMQHNLTEFGGDDRQYSMNSRVPLVAGFAALSNDGCLDSRLKNRIDGVKVELYLTEAAGGRLITSTTTKYGGFYQLPIEPIYIYNTEGKEFFIAIKPLEGYNISGKPESDGYFLMKNGINQNAKSDSFYIYDTEQIKIINIGLTHN
jgi:hypothetical protein